MPARAAGTASKQDMTNGHHGLLVPLALLAGTMAAGAQERPDLPPVPRDTTRADAPPATPGAADVIRRALEFDAAAPPSPLDLRQTPRWTFDSCWPPWCGEDAGRLPPVTNGNAPWLLEGRVSRRSERGAVSAGLIGQRNMRLPLYMTRPPGSLGFGGLGLPQASSSSMGDTRTAWQLNLGAERTITRHRDGATASVFGEAFLPLGSFAPAPPSQDAPAPDQRAVLFGIRVRF